MNHIYFSGRWNSDLMHRAYEHMMQYYKNKIKYQLRRVWSTLTVETSKAKATIYNMIYNSSDRREAVPFLCIMQLRHKACRAYCVKVKLMIHRQTRLFTIHSHGNRKGKLGKSTTFPFTTPPFSRSDWSIFAMLPLSDTKNKCIVFTMTLSSRRISVRVQPVSGPSEPVLSHYDVH